MRNIPTLTRADPPFADPAGRGSSDRRPTPAAGHWRRRNPAAGMVSARRADPYFKRKRA